MHRFIILLLVALIGLFSGHNSVMAQVAPQPCDPQFYKQMQSRVWLEAEREIMQNQNLIYKPDSVLDYVCFDKALSKAAWDGGDIFTHTSYFGGSQLIARGSGNALENALNRTVFQAYQSYRNQNFAHSLLGGRGEHVGLGQFDSAAIEAPTTRANYTCNVMANVWRTAKCMNFIHNTEFENKDGFYPFSEIGCAPGSSGCSAVAGYDTIRDTRQYPASMACNSEGTSPRTWAEALRVSSNLGDNLYQFATPLGTIFTDVGSRVLPGSCTAAILTGVTVVLSGGPAHNDGVCTNPGCTYQASGSCI